MPPLPVDMQFRKNQRSEASGRFCKRGIGKDGIVLCGSSLVLLSYIAE